MRVDFRSNDYLGLTRCQKLMHEIERAYFAVIDEDFRLHGTSGSVMVMGKTPAHQRLEKKLATFYGEQAALLFTSGYMANIGLISAIASKQDSILIDSRVHPSSYDGAILSGATILHIDQHDIESIQTALNQATGKKFVFIESLCPFTGKVSPLPQIYELSCRFGAHLIADEAHATTIFGKQGRGLVNHFGLEGKLFAHMHTFSKGLGLNGATVLGSQQLIDFLMAHSRPVRSGTGLPLHSVVAIDCAHERMQQLNDERAHLVELQNHFATIFQQTCESPIQILPKLDGDAKERLIKAEINVRPLELSTRVSLHSFNTKEQIDQLFEVLHLLKV